MRTIWKFMLEPLTVLDLPKGAQILSVHEQANKLCMWALVDLEQPTEQREFVVYGTGHEVPLDQLIFIGTAHLSEGTLVLHVFEKVL